ncbi:threonine-phosphate decarboxylase [Clostridium sp. D2Q-11]|uniref:threonine-phosphate decarboxylase n=1 Tax=Anaeromonas frigoriresistens TaxID=2683708 RepID=A0A942UYB1_9FIRM|nr:threonine-phosphate decarboxylase CobD [Anaeromonas frigoriresistens]MBS4538561.1 threonine-phosphate decarboxylase [Anaeromonas frigoriresistens]
MNKHGGYIGEEKDEVLDFSVNINPLGPSEKVVNNLKESLNDIHRYPEIDGAKSIKHIADQLKITENSIILGNGAIQLIYLFARAMNFKKILIIQPTFNEYERAFKLAGGDVEYHILYPKSNFIIDINKLKDKMYSTNPDCVVLCNPNNPTGVYFDKDFIEDLLKISKEMNSFLLLDESFVDFLEKKSAIDLIDEYDLFILRSLTKFYSIPGIRVGFGLGSEKVIKRLSKYQEPWSLNTLALKAIPDIINDHSFNKKTLEWLYEERQFMLYELKKIRYIKVFQTYTNFILCRLRKSSSYKLQDLLLKEKIYIRTCEDFNGLDNKYFRIAIKNREDNIKLLNALQTLDIN